MLDNNDIQKLVEVFATREEAVTKLDFDEFKNEYKKEFSKFLTKLDEKTGKEADKIQEETMLKNKVDRHDRWINKIANKVDVKLES